MSPLPVVQVKNQITAQVARSALAVAFVVIPFYRRLVSPQQCSAINGIHSRKCSERCFVQSCLEDSCECSYLAISRNRRRGICA